MALLLFSNVISQRAIKQSCNFQGQMTEMGGIGTGDITVFVQEAVSLQLAL